MPRILTSLLILLIPFELLAGDTPEHVYSAIVVWNGSAQCSGAIISKGEKFGAGVSAGHCFHGNIGNSFRVGYVDGSTATATLLAHDVDLDLSLFSVPSSSILAASPIPDVAPSSVAAYENIGFPLGIGPTYFKLKSRRSLGTAPGTDWRWVFDVEGRIDGGASGSPVFCNGQMVAVTSHKSVGHDDGRLLYCSPHQQLVEFVKRHESKLRDCGPWSCPPKSAEQAPPPPKPEGTSPDAPGPQRWQPKPNIKVEPYSGKGPRPSDLDSDKDMAREIDKLRQELKALRGLIGQNGTNAPAPGPKGDKGDTGPQGLPGPVGRAGSDAGSAGLDTLRVRLDDIAALAAKGITFEIVAPDGTVLQSEKRLLGEKFRMRLAPQK